MNFRCILSLVFNSFMLFGCYAKTTERVDSDTSDSKSTRSTYNCGQPVIVDTRIVGGNESLAGKFPWQILFKGLSSSTGQQQSFCGGSVLSNQWIVTAAHCTAGKSAETIHVVLGDFDRTASDSGNDKEFAVAAIYDHPGYNSVTLRNDISLLKLGGSATYSNYIIPACLPTQSADVSAGTTCWITGWGVTNTATSSTPSVMNEARVPIIDQSACSSWYGSVGISIEQEMVCAGFQQGGVDTCQGDSGGPLVCQDNSNVYYLEGITSFGIGCAQSERPGVYARVSEFRTWLDTTMASNAATSTFFGYTTTSCGSTINSSQIVRLPVDSETQLYAASMNCVWTLVPPNGTVTTRLTFVERFGVEPLNSCQYDYISIVTSSGAQVGDAKICGFSLPSTLVSTDTTSITITFRSDTSMQFEGFAINVEFLSATDYLNLIQTWFINLFNINSGSYSSTKSSPVLIVFSTAFMLISWMLG